MSALTALVDLDGTLTDPADGIIGGFQFALRKVGAHVPEKATLGWVIGPPLRKAFPKLLPDPTTASVEAAVTAYREYYSATGIYEATVYAGIPEAMEQLRGAGFRLLVCTAKPRVFAGQVIEHFGLAHYFEGVYGAELDGRFDDKGDLIEHILAERGLSPTGTVMIGDRGSDMTAAIRNAIPGIGVTWGYGALEELQAAGAERICRAPIELAACIQAVLRG